MKIVFEIQMAADGSIGITPPTSYADNNQADQAYYAALSAAAVSSVPVHTVVQMRHDGEDTIHKTYYHEA